MPDAFRPEVLVSFMQFIVDEPIVPVLFMRTVRSRTSGSIHASNGADGPFRPPALGLASRFDLQAIVHVRGHDVTFAVDCEKSLDDRTLVGRVHPLRQTYGTEFVPGRVAIAD